MIKKLIKLACGILLSSFAITCVIHAGLGCFPITATNLALANWFNTTVGISGMVVELVILGLAMYLGEGVTLTGIVNATVGSLLVDIWNPILPSHPIMILGILLLPIAWYFSGSVGLGDTNQNLLMNAIIKRTGKSVGVIRTIQEVTFMIIGFLGARNFVTPLTIILSFFFGYILQFIYKLLKYDPTKVEHSYLIKGKGREKVVECSSFEENEK